MPTKFNLSTPAALEEGNCVTFANFALHEEKKIMAPPPRSVREIPKIRMLLTYPLVILTPGMIIQSIFKGLIHKKLKGELTSSPLQSPLDVSYMIPLFHHPAQPV